MCTDKILLQSHGITKHMQIVLMDIRSCASYQNRFPCANENCTCYGTKHLPKIRMLTHNQEAVLNSKRAVEGIPRVKKTRHNFDSPLISQTCPRKTVIKTFENIHKCKICGFSFHTALQLKSHGTSHSDERPFKCKLCNYSAKRKGNLSDHIKTHSGVKPYKCNLCDYSCLHGSHLATHIRSHTGEKPFSCSVCNHTAASSSDITVHMRIHAKHKPYGCLQCDYKSTHSGNLRKHIQALHEERQCDFKCSLCSKLFFSKRHLQLHINTHTQEKPYNCEFCQRQFSTTSAKKGHVKICKMRPDGKQIKLFKCQYCHHGSSSKQNQTTHERCCKQRPDGLFIKPFKCQFCANAYASKGSKVHHEKSCSKLRK